VSELKINPVNTLGHPRGDKFGNVLLNPVEVRSLYRELSRLELNKKFGINLFMEGPPALFSLQEIALGQCGTCPFLNILGVLSNGDLSFCGVGYSESELRLGNAAEVNLQEVWTSHHTLLSARQQIPNEIDGICKECVFLPKCQGSCRAIAYQQNHSLQEPHPWCHYLNQNSEFPAIYRLKRAN
jgi:radical SAM protein with 4Fe4S-binding SPASM domain